jgi:hypothetical protein
MPQESTGLRLLLNAKSSRSNYLHNPLRWNNKQACNHWKESAFGTGQPMLDKDVRYHR